MEIDQMTDGVTVHIRCGQAMLRLYSLTLVTSSDILPQCPSCTLISAMHQLSYSMSHFGSIKLLSGCYSYK